jgi:amidophosphoribosyltransferase
VEELVDSSALFAVSGHRDAAYLAYVGLHAQQHRGVGGVAIAAADGALVRFRRGPGLVQEAIDGAALLGLPGALAIGKTWGTTPHEGEPFELRDAHDADGVVFARYRAGQVAAAVSGRFTNGPRLRRELKEQGALFHTGSDAEILLHLLAVSTQKTFVNRLVDALWKVEGAYSLVVQCEDRVVAVRDPAGFRPLLLGKLQDAVLIASEESAIRLVGGELRRELAPGELVVLDGRAVQSVTPFAACGPAPCVQEWVGVARSESRVAGASVHDLRVSLGERLAEAAPCPDGELVTGWGGSADGAALGYARASGLPLVHAILREPFTARRFEEPPSGIRDFGTRLYWRVVPGAVTERSVVLVVPSLVTGLGVRKAVLMLVEAGAREVHVRVASPPLNHACPYGVSTPTADELLARLKGPDAVHWLGARTLGTLSAEELGAVVDTVQPGGRCDACLTGNRPLALPTAAEDQLELF